MHRMHVKKGGRNFRHLELRIERAGDCAETAQAGQLLHRCAGGACLPDQAEQP